MTATRAALLTLLGLVLATIPVGTASASIIQLPAVQITADGSVIPIPDSSQPRLGTDGLWHFDFRFESNDYSLHAFFTADPDPSISYGVAVTDFGAPSTFGFLFGTPIVLPAGPNVVASSLSGTLTDGGIDGVSATGLSQVSDVGMPITNMGVDLSGPCSSPGTCGPFAAGPLPGPAGTWTYMQTSLQFTMSGGNDQASFTGFASIDPAARAPEPGTVLLLCAGLGLAAWRRSRAER